MLRITLLLVLLSSMRFSVLAEAHNFVIDNFEKPSRWKTFAWNDVGAKKSTSRIRVRRETSIAKEGTASLKVVYTFPSNKCLQVHFERSISCLSLFQKLSFWVKGDGSQNRLEVWLHDRLSGRWFGQGSKTLDFTNWQRLEFRLTGFAGVPCLSDEVTVLRFVIVQKGGLGENVIYIDSIEFEEPTTPPVPAKTFNVRSLHAERAKKYRIGLITGENLSTKGPLGLSAVYVSAVLKAAGYRVERLHSIVNDSSQEAYNVLVAIGSTFPLALARRIIQHFEGGRALVLLTSEALTEPCQFANGRWRRVDPLPAFPSLRLELGLPTVVAGKLSAKEKWRLQFPGALHLPDYPLRAVNAPFHSLLFCARRRPLEFAVYRSQSGTVGDPRLWTIQPRTVRNAVIMKVAIGDFYSPSSASPLIVLPEGDCRGRVVMLGFNRINSPLRPGAYNSSDELLVRMVDMAVATIPQLEQWAFPSSPLRFIVDDFEGAKSGWAFRAWPDENEEQKSTSTISLKITAQEAKTGKSGLMVCYNFPSRKCRQVEFEKGVSCPVHLSSYRFWVRGDGSGNRLEMWMCAGGKWYCERGIRLDFKGWRRVSGRLKYIHDMTKISIVKFVIVESGGLGQHTIGIDDLAFVPYSEVVPPPVERPKGPFRWEVKKVGYKRVIFINGRPMYGWLDWNVSGVNTWNYWVALSAGMNVRWIHLDWSWLFPQNEEPEFEDAAIWQALERKLEWMEKQGLGVFFLLPGQSTPAWFFKKYPEEPKSRAAGYPFTADLKSPNYRAEMERYIKVVIKHTARHRNVIGYGVLVPSEMSSSWYAEGGVNYQVFLDLRTPRMMREFRQFLKDKYHGQRKALASAWKMEDITFENANFPSPPKWSSGYDRIFSGLGPIFLWAHWEDEYAPTQWADFLEFCERYSCEASDWIAQQIKRLAPNKLTIWVRPDEPWWRMYGETRMTVGFDAFMPSVTTMSYMLHWARWHEALLNGVAMNSRRIVFGFTDVQDNLKDVEPELLARDLTFPCDALGGLVLGITPVHRLNYGGLLQWGHKNLKTFLHAYHPRLGIFVSRAFERLTQAPRTHYSSEFGAHGIAGILSGPPTGYLRIDHCAVFDEDPSTFYNVNVIAIPYTPVISRELERELENYVSLGGGIIAEAWVGKYDENLKARPHGTLALFDAQVAQEQKLLAKRLPVRGPGETPTPPKQNQSFDKTVPPLMLYLKDPRLSAGIVPKTLLCSYWAIHKQDLETLNGQIVAEWKDTKRGAAVLGATQRTLYLGTCLFGRYADLVADAKKDPRYQREPAKGARLIANFVAMVEAQQHDLAEKELRGAKDVVTPSFRATSRSGEILIQASLRYLRAAEQANAARLFIRSILLARLSRNAFLLAKQVKQERKPRLAPIVATRKAVLPTLRRAKTLFAFIQTLKFQPGRTPASFLRSVKQLIKEAEEETWSATPDLTRAFVLARVAHDLLVAQMPDVGTHGACQDKGA